VSGDTTGAGSASVSYVTSTSTSQPSTVSPGSGPRDLTIPLRQPTDYRLGIPPLGVPRPPVAPWLADVQRRLSGSIAMRGGTALHDRTGLAREVVRAANSFFELTSDLLPAEPYLYSSQSGDLVAEFSAPLGRMTIIISTDSAIAHASVGGRITQKSFVLTPEAQNSLRPEIDAITSPLRAGIHGSVDTGR
jgi:hypothetical protein